MAKMTYDQLVEKLKTNDYTPRTDEQLRAEAENRYSASYNQQKLAAQQNYETSDLGYQQQLKTLEDSLADSQKEITKNTMDSAAAADRYSLTRGMSRASYSVANKARIQNEGISNLAGVMKQYSNQVGSVQASRTQLAQQLANTLAQYDVEHMSNINKYIDDQKKLDYDRKLAADDAYNQLQMALYQYSRM